MSTGVNDSLLELYHASSPFLDNYPWEWEVDRWGELLVCFLVSQIAMEPELARHAVETLKELGMIAPALLANPGDEHRQFIRRVLMQDGVEAELASDGVDLLVALARVAEVKWGGHVQRFLREHGLRMADDLKSILVGVGLDDQSAGKTAVLWLQNVANIPVLIPGDVHIREFGLRFRLSERQLLDAADKIGINVAVLDDVLALHYKAGSFKRRPRSAQHPAQHSIANETKRRAKRTKRS